MALVERWYWLPHRYAAIEPAAEHDMLVHATERVDAMAVAVLFLVLPMTALVIGIGAILLWLSPVLVAVVVALIPIALLISYWLRRRLRAATRMFPSIVRALQPRHVARTRGHGPHRRSAGRRAA